MNTNTKRKKKGAEPSKLFPKTSGRFKPSDKVRIKSGPYAGAEGVVESTNTSRCGKRVAVRFRQLNGFLMTALDVELEFATSATRQEYDRLSD
jgi:transcription antitermination factor NusG